MDTENGTNQDRSLGRKMGRAEWERGEGGEMAFEEEAELSQRLGGQGGGGQERKKRGGGGSPWK